MPKIITGRCCCSKIRYEAKDPNTLWYCHCEQCRRMTGHYMAASQVELANITIQGAPKWHYVSDYARYGFCPDCGSHLFWRNDKNPYLSVTGGSIDCSRGLEVGGHIFCAEKADYYQIPDGETQFFRWDEQFFGKQ